jgi:hypothetical protein
MKTSEKIPVDKTRSDHYSLARKAVLAVSSLRQNLRPRKNLIAGPYAGEFGYELMQWQGYVRARRAKYEEVHVITFPGREYLYEGCSVSAHDIPLHLAGFRYGVISPTDSCRMANRKASELGWTDYDVFLPALLATQYHKRLFWRQDFRLFEEPPINGIVRDITFHFRAVQKIGDHAKNYAPALAEELVQLCLSEGLSASCIGHPDYSLCPKGCEDQRSVSLKGTIAAICSARAMVGEISGPTHLANLCGKPAILWAPFPYKVDYARRWNPFDVPLYIAADDTHEPAPQRVLETILDALQDMKSRTDNFQRPLFRLPAVRIAYY